MTNIRFDQKTEKTNLNANDEVVLIDSESSTGGNPNIKKAKLSNIKHSQMASRDVAGNHAKLIPTADGTTAIQITKADGTTVVLNADTTNKIIGIIDAVINYGHASESYQITERGVSLGFPVATIRPVTTNKNSVLDIMPNGAPTEFGTNGIAWLDICNADAKNSNPSMNCARVGVYTNKVIIGALSYNGATDVPLNFAVGTTGNIEGRFNTNGELELLTNTTLGSNLKTSSNNASYYGDLSTFRDDLTYDSNKFQGVTRLQATGKALVLQAANATNGDIIFVAGGGTITSNERLRIKATGEIIIKNSKTPASAGATGTAGEIAWDTNYFYVCVATNTWKRTALSSW